jgi:sporulation protein YlmC with PRC-barrel domain
MSELVTAALDRKVVARDDAEEVGRVKTFVFDDRLQRIVSVQVTGSKRKPGLVAWQDVVGFGPDAVIVSSAEALRPPEDDHEAAVARHKIEPVGALVLDDRGDAHGTALDVRFDPGTGAVEAVIGADREWDATCVRGFGSFAIVVDRSL